ncbi:MAG: NAD-dependent epimerase/dehydratase family protein [Pseudomonadales bacterium]|nr:NAD-dependent epimerase/dehydratase family protein [Gammaproteobacteria bacterium]
MNSRLKLLITGGRGRIAGLLGPMLGQRGFEVQRASRIADERFVDYRELVSPATLASFDTVLHLAWSTVPATAEQLPGSEWEVDLPYLARLLRAAAQLPAAQRPHLVFFSSGGTVYGEAPAPRGRREDDPCHPIGWYGRGKLAAEQLLNAFAVACALDCAILRVSNPYGYLMQPAKPQGLIAHLLDSARKRQGFEVWGDGSATKDYLSASDLCAAVVAVLESRATGTFNIGSGTTHSVNEIIALVRELSGVDFAVRYREPFAWDVSHSRLEITKMKTVLGWEPRVALRAGMADFWANGNSG